jgi:hypothetical protein
MSRKFTTIVIDGNALIELIKAEQEGENTMGKYDDLVGRGEALIKGGPPSGTFKDIEAKIRASGGAADPAAVAAKVYREKYGAETLARRSAAARKKKKKDDESMQKSFKELVSHGEQLFKGGKALSKAVGGEGARGGHVIGHTAKGNPIYAKHDIGHHEEMIAHHKKMARKKGMSKDSRGDHRYAAKQHEEAKGMQERLKVARERGEAGAEKFAQTVHETSRDANFSSAQAHGKSWKDATEVATGGMKEAMSKAIGGEGTRGGVIIGHTVGGKPIYQHSAAKDYHLEMHNKHKSLAEKYKNDKAKKNLFERHHEAAEAHKKAMTAHAVAHKWKDEKDSESATTTTKHATLASRLAEKTARLHKSMDDKPVTDSLPEVQAPPEPSEADRQIERFIDRDDIIAEGLPFSLRSGPSGNEPMSKANDSPGRLLDPVPGASYSSFDLNIIGVGDMNQVDGNGGLDEKKNPGQKYKEPEDIITTEIPNSPMVFGRSR